MESELQSAWGYLEEACQHADVAEAVLESERATFEEEECLGDDLNQALVA